MKSITKYFTSLRQAERYQNKLYERYSSVQLVNSPRFTEAGHYRWTVK